MHKTTLRGRVEQRFVELDRNQVWLAKKLGVSRQIVSGWLKRGQIPSHKLLDVARHLECTTDSLLTGDNNPVLRVSQLSPLDQKLLEKFKQLSSDDKQRELTYLEGYIKDRGRSI